ncbi:MAG TPA: hypothetical protein VFN46_03100 [Acetobacteraceae bacterium]|nr:hypothetical protein [Acetobacteraceae bacterium]
MGSNSFRRIALAQGLLRDTPLTAPELTAPDLTAPDHRDAAPEPPRAETRREAEEERAAQA